MIESNPSNNTKLIIPVREYNKQDNNYEKNNDIKNSGKEVKSITMNNRILQEKRLRISQNYKDLRNPIEEYQAGKIDNDFSNYKHQVIPSEFQKDIFYWFGSLLCCDIFEILDAK